MMLELITVASEQLILTSSLSLPTNFIKNHNTYEAKHLINDIKSYLKNELYIDKSPHKRLQ